PRNRCDWIQLHPIRKEATPQPRQQTMRSKGRVPTGFAPRLRQRQTAHNVADAHRRAGIGAEYCRTGQLSLLQSLLRDLTVYTDQLRLPLNNGQHIKPRSREGVAQPGTHSTQELEVLRSIQCPSVIAVVSLTGYAA